MLLRYSVKLHIQRSADALCEHHRLVWTPYMPDVEENAESSADEGRPLAITHGNQVHKIMKLFSLNSFPIDKLGNWHDERLIRTPHKFEAQQGGVSGDSAVPAAIN